MNSCNLPMRAISTLLFRVAICFMAFFNADAVCAQESASVSLTDQERTWLKAHPNIQIGYTDADVLRTDCPKVRSRRNHPESPMMPWKGCNVLTGARRISFSGLPSMPIFFRSTSFSGWHSNTCTTAIHTKAAWPSGRIGRNWCPF